MNAPCLRPAWTALLVLLLTTWSALACQVPVFRFALERWEADAYLVVITPASPDGELSEEEAAVQQLLESTREEMEVAANIWLKVGEPADAESGGSLAVYYPQKIRGMELAPIWQGAATVENARKILDSPARRELTKRILAGDSATWILLKSGAPEKDQQSATNLESFLSEAAGMLKIPDGVVTRAKVDAGEFVGNPDNILRSEVPLKIDFSTIEISRDDPAEEIFLEMLLNLESDLHEFEGDPMVFPVFGRGRVLEPLIGPGINRDNALEYAAYLCGACSCEVKDQNPGMDLLIAADWETALESGTVVIDKILPPLEGTAALTAAAKGSASQGALLKPHFPEKAGDATASGEESAEVPSQTGSDATGAPDDTLIAAKPMLSPALTTGIAVGGAIVLIGIASVLVRRKSN